MKQSTFSAVMANSIKNLLQGYTKGIRFVAVLTVLLTMGIGQAWGAEKTITLTHSSFSLTTTYAQKTATVDGIGFTVNQGYKGTNNVIQMNSSKGDGTLYNTTSITGLKSITINVSSGSKTYTITSGTSQNPTGNSQTGTSTKTFSIPSGDTYFQLEVSGASYFTSIVITYEETTSGGDDNTGGGGDGEYTWELVTDASTLKAGDEIVIAASGSDYALSTTQNSNNRGQAAVTKNGNNITFTETTQILTLETGTVDNTLAFNTGAGYLYAASSSSNHLKTQTTNNGNGSWNISIDNNTGIATIVAQGANTRNLLRYNSSSSIFSCYSSGQLDVSIYKKPGGTTTYTITSTLSHVTADGSNPTTITSEAEDLTLSYSAESGWNLPENITITMGGNELTDSEYVWDNANGDLLIQPTSGFTGNIVVTINGWQQLAAPTGLNVTNITSSGATLNWNAVTHATSYTVQVYGENDEIIAEYTDLTQTTKEVSGLESDTYYIWAVTAIGDGTTYTDSEESETAEFTTLNPCEKLGNATGLEVVTNYVQDGKTYVKFSWTPAAPSKEGTTQKLCYGLVGQEKTCTVSAKHLGEAKGVASSLPAGEYEWSIQALGDGTNYCDGDVVEGTNFYIYSITYNTNGGNTIAATSGTTLPDPLPTTTKTGYTFAGWYTDSEFKTLATAGAPITQNTTLYAKWTINQYTVTLNPNYPDGKTGTFKDKDGNTISGDLVLTYDYGTASQTLTDLYQSIKLEGYRFDGWYTAKGASDGTVSGSKWSETKIITDNLNFYAKWTEVDCRWIETDIANILPKDEVVVTMQKIGSQGLAAYYALNNSGGTTENPKADEVTVDNNTIISKVSTEIIWNISSTTDGYILYPNGSTTTWLYCTQSGNTVRVGTNNDNVFTIKNGYFYHLNTTDIWEAYLGVSFQTTQYRWCHYPKNDNQVINDQTLKFYKRVCVDESNPWCTVTFDAGSGSCDTESLIGTKKEGITLPTANPPAACATDGWKFAGWWTEAVAETITSPGELLTAGSNYKPTSDCTLYAVYSYTEAGGSGSTDYVLTNIGDIADDDIVVLTMTYTDGTVYALSSINESSDTPPAPTVTVSDNKLSAEPAEALKWNISNSSGTLTIYPNGTTEKWLYCTNSNDGVRIGTNTNKAFTIDASSGYLKNTNTNRYVGVYRTNPDWRCYDNTTGNTVNQTLGFYVKSSGGSTTTYNSNPTCLVPVWEGATIDKTSFTVNCGERSPMTGANGAAKITFSAEKIYNFTKDIMIEASAGFIVSTSQNEDANYQSSVSLSPLVGTTNANTFYDKFVYVRAEAPAQSDTDLEGTITIKNSKGETLQTFSVTADVTCTQYTLTLVDRGVSTEQPTKYYAGETIDEAPADPEGVCTDPIHYVFDGWAAATVAEGSTTYTKVTFPYTVTGNTKFYAVYRYVEGGGNGDYNLVTSALDDWSGDYLIAYSDQIFANGKIGGKDGIGAAGEKVDLSSYITNNTIPAAEGDKYKVSLEAINGGYLLKTQDGQYNYQSSNTNGLEATTNKNTATNYKLSVNFVSFEEINLCLSGDAEGAIFQYNTGQQGYFRFYKNGGQNPVYLYKKADGTTYYTTSPVCGPHLVITDGKEIYVTGGNAGGTRDLVIAQQKVSYKATRLNVGPTSQVPDVKVVTNGITVGGVVTSDVKVTINQTKEQQTDGTYTITGTITVQYQPSANNKQEDIQVQLAVDYNAEARDNFTVHARSLPSEFVIVAKSGDKWYALNGDMNINAANPANGQVTLDDDANPTKAAYAPCNTIYTFDGLPNTGDRTYVRFQGTDGAWLWASSGTNVGIQNNVLKTTPEGSNMAYNWKLYTEDNITYRFGNANSSRQLTLNGENFGMYTSGVQDIRILPYEAKCLYNYAPSNLKVSVLKGSYVTLTWDAVAGATKYQYSTDATNWNDAGTEPTVTINDLIGDTEYTYYIRAYHEDTGVSQECIDYAEITFTTANCDDVPTDITYSADLNSITISWTAAAPTATIKYNTKEDGTGGGGIINNATSPYEISGGLDKNTTYYIQILADGTCASPIIPVKTEDVEVDVVEWDPQAIIVDINTDETIGVTLENEVSYGSGLGSLAEDLFFSKYFEGSGSLKMIAIYNGTGKDVDLTDYFIYKGHNGSADFDEDDQDKILYPLSELGVIKQGQEIVLYSWPLNTDAEASVYSCSQTFLHSIANESGQDANPRWILCGKDPTNSITPIYSDAMNFNGDDPLLLYKDGEIIDVFGATAGESPENNVICDGYNENGDHKTRSDESWVANDVSNMDYGKTAEDFPNGEIPDDVNVDDPTITAYTARVIMFRKNSVTSGANAVTKNTDDFHTFAEEWEVRQVCRISGDGDLTCAAYQELGTFDYSDYYTKYEPMGEGTTFDENARNADGTVTIPITDLYKHACSNIRVKLTNSNGDVLTDREYKVPIMITTDQATAYTEANKDDNAFYALQDNLATIEVDENGDEIARHPLTIEQVREICKTCDVVIRDSATLTKAADDDDYDHPQVNNVFIYEGASLVIPDGTNETITSLSLRRKGDIVASAKVEKGGNLHLPASATAPIYLDMRIDANNWHWFTLPYDCNIADVTWVDGTPAQYNKDWFIMYYDGNSRANEQSIYENHWKVYNGTTIEAGKGYIVGIQGDITHPDYTFELRFPMTTEVLTNEHTDKTVAVNAWGVKMDITPNKKGWNLVGNPYLDYYKTSENISFTGLSLIEYLGIDPVTGERLYQKGGNVPFLVTPVDGGWYEYQQELASDIEMMPFTAYFVQVGDPANASHTDGMELHAEFVSDHRGRMSLIRRAPQEVDGEQEPVIVRVEVANTKGESDKTTLIIDDRFTNEYEMNGDFFKWFGDYYRRYTKPVLYSMGADHGKRAFNALSEQLAAQPVALGMFAAQAGDYTFSLTRKRCDLSRVEEVWLYDATTATYTNLMQQDYTFTTAKTEGEGRFYLSVKMKQKTPTAVENVNGNLSLVAHQQTLVLSGLPAEAQVWVYDATGKLLHSEHTTAYQRIYPVQQAGVYFVSVKGQGDAQTLSTIVK